MDRGTDVVVAKEGGLLEASEEKDEPCSSKTKHDTQKSGCHVVVVFVAIVLVVGLVIGVEEAQETDVAKWVPDGIHDEDTDDQEGKDIVGEASGESDESCQIEESSERDVDKEPDADPGVEREEWYIQGLGHVVDDSGESEDGSSRSNDASGHSTDETVDHPDP